jgi:hypothetical protein
VVDNNIMLSANAIRNQSQGGAFVHNFIAGGIFTWPDLNRFTPYFLPHSTDMLALTTIMAGDDRFYNNVFTGPYSSVKPNSNYKQGLEGYNEAKLPVWMSGNVFYNGAKPCKAEQNFIELPTHQPAVRLEEVGEGIVLHFTLEPTYYSHKGSIITSEILGRAKIPKAAFDNPDGTPLRIDRDYFGNLRPGETTSAGPFSNLNPGKIVLKVW